MPGRQTLPPTGGGLCTAKGMPVVDFTLTLNADGPWLVVYPEVYTTEELTAGITKLQDAVKQSTAPFTILFDASAVKSSTSERRRLIADFLKQNRADLVARCRGMAFVLPSAVTRGALTAILWLADTGFPTKTVATREAGDKWLRAQAA